MSDAPKPNIVRFKNVLASYFHGYAPRKGAKPRYESAFLFDPTNKEHAAKILELKTEAARVAREKFGEKVDLKKLKMCWDVNPEDAKYAPGWWKLQTWANLDNKPTIVNRGMEPTDGKSPESVYSGATVNSSTTFFAWEFTEKAEDGSKGMTKRGVSANLRSIQFVEATPVFSERAETNIDDEFEALGDAAAKAAVGAAGAKDPFDD